MHRFSLGAVVPALVFMSLARPCFAREIGTFPSVDGVWEVTLETLPVGGQDRPLDKWHVASLEARIAPRGTHAARAAAAEAVTAPPLADSTPAPAAAPSPLTVEQWLAGVPSAPAPATAPGIPLAPEPDPSEPLPRLAGKPVDTAPAFDARMPEHGHGLLLKPRLAPLGPDAFRIDGVKLHMAGAWELALTLPAGGATTRFVVPLEL